MYIEWEFGIIVIGKYVELGMSVVWEEFLCNVIELF